MIWLLAACTAMTRAATPLSLEYRMISQSQTCIGNTRIRVDTDGSVRVARNTKACPRGELWSEPWPDAPTYVLSAWQRARLLASVDADDVWSHATTLADATTQDGYREELDVRVGERTRQLVSGGGRSDTITRIRKLLEGWKG